MMVWTTSMTCWTGLPSGCSIIDLYEVKCGLTDSGKLGKCMGSRRSVARLHKAECTCSTKCSYALLAFRLILRYVCQVHLAVLGLR